MPMLVSGANANANGATVKSTVKDGGERVGTSVVMTQYEISECETRDEERVCSV
jgi:predicted amino acid-binding ACT domain protein